MKPVAITALAFTAALAACHSPAPVASTPAPMRRPATDSAASEALMRAGLARRDSIAARSRADALAEAERRHADSVRAQIQDETGMETAGMTTWGLPPADSTAIADRIHFAYDRSDLSPDDLQELEAKRQVMVAHPEVTVQIAGNCDERGSDEYNLALGERRAAAARRWLIATGIAGSRISIVSYGEERPLDRTHTEAAWAQNRRDDFLVLNASRQ